MMGLVVADLFATLGLDSSALDRGLAGVTKHKGLADIGASFTRAGSAMTKSITLPIVAAGTASVVMAAKFEGSMKLIQTQAGGSAADVKKLSAQVLELGTKGQHGPQELSTALYHLKSVGMDNKAAMDALTQSEKLASVGHADLEATTNAVAGAYKSGIKGAQDFGTTVGTLNAIIGAGNLRMEDLNSALGTGFLVTAQTFGVSLTSVGAALAMMTSRGIPATRAAGALKMAFSGIAAPSAQASKAMDGLGLSGLALATSMREKGLGAALDMLQAKLKDLSKTDQSIVLTQMFGAKSSQAILTLLGNLKDYDRTQKQISDNTSKFADLAAAQSEDATAKWDHFKSSMESAGILLGDVLLPTVVGFADALGGVGKWLSELSPETRKWAVDIALVAAATGPLLIGIGKTAQGVAALTKMYQGLRVAMLGAGAAQGAAGVVGAGSGATAGVGVALAGIPALIPVAAIAAGVAGALVLGVRAGLKQAKEDKAAQLGFWEDFWKTNEAMITSGGDWFKNLVDKLAGTGGGMSSAIKTLTDQLAKLRAKFAERYAMGDITGALEIYTAMNLIEGKLGILRDHFITPMAVGHVKNGLWIDGIDHAISREQYFRDIMLHPMAVGHVQNALWLSGINQGVTREQYLRDIIKLPMAVGHLNVTPWTDPIAKAMKAYNAWKSVAQQGFSTGRLNVVPPATGYGGGGGPATGERAQIVAAATSRVGDPYVWGGSSPGGFDCSGLMSWAYQSSGDSITRVPTYSGRAISRGQIQPADIMFYNPNAIQNGVRVPFGHFKMYIGDNKTVESTTGGVQIRTADWAGAAAIHTYLARGGIATSPSIVGEAGPEAVIPLTNARRGAAVMREAGLLPGEGAAPVIHEHIHVHIPGGTVMAGNAEDLGHQIAPAVGRAHDAAAAARARSR